MDPKLFKKTFTLICNACGAFAHTQQSTCDKCGKESLRKATKEDYKNRLNSM